VASNNFIVQKAAGKPNLSSDKLKEMMGYAGIMGGGYLTTADTLRMERKKMLMENKELRIAFLNQLGSEQRIKLSSLEGDNILQTGIVRLANRATRRPRGPRMFRN